MKLWQVAHFFHSLLVRFVIWKEKRQLCIFSFQITNLTKSEWKKRGNLSEFHSERNYYLQNWYFNRAWPSKPICQKRVGWPCLVRSALKRMPVQDFNSFSIMFYYIFSTTYQKIGGLFCSLIFLDFRTVWIETLHDAQKLSQIGLPYICMYSGCHWWALL